jgi:chaperone modulatory protein CbpM
MTSDHDDPLLFEEDRRLPGSELCDLSGLSEAELRELVDYGALAPAGEVTESWVFSMRSITVARTARRLREDFELEPHGVALVLAYLERIHELEDALRGLRAQLPR